MVVDPGLGIPLELDEGSELIAVLLAVGLWGITCVQTLFYFIQFVFLVSSIVLRVMVAWLWLADTVHQFLLIKGVYGELIINSCDDNQVLHVNVEYLWQFLLTALVAFPAQLFFLNRIAVFSGKRKLLFALWAPAATFQLAGVIAFITFGTITPTSRELVSPTPSIIFTTVQATAAVVDISITAGLIYLLLRSRESAQYRMRSIIQKLLILSVGTGVWTTLFAVSTLITMLVFPNTLIYVGVYFPLCPLYCNTVLANLNAREVIEKLERRSSRDSINWQDTQLSGPVISGQWRGPGREVYELSHQVGTYHLDRTTTGLKFLCTDVRFRPHALNVYPGTVGALWR